jgi:putative PIN family toxin of toxin-antitoxin system
MSDHSGTGLKPAVVLDTNAVLDWLVFADPRIQPLAAAIRDGAVRWLVAVPLREELERVLARPAIAKRHNRSEQALAVFDLLGSLCVPPAPAGPGWVCRDADDQVFLDLALATRARWLISRDKALLALRRRVFAQGLIIAKPEGWIAA